MTANDADETEGLMTILNRMPTISVLPEALSA